MKGKVIQINTTDSLVSVQVESRDITIIELLDPIELNLGDILTGELRELGDATLYNQTTKEHLDVVIQNINCNTTNGYVY